MVGFFPLNSLQIVLVIGYLDFLYKFWNNLQKKKKKPCWGFEKGRVSPVYPIGENQGLCSRGPSSP